MAAISSWCPTPDRCHRAPPLRQIQYHGAFSKEIAMNTIPLRCGVFALACLCLAACKGKNDPLKPTVSPPAVVAPAASA
jgi:hypothetical protein